MVDVVESADEIQGEKLALLDVGGTLVSRNYLRPSQAEYNIAFGVDPEEDQELYDRHTDDTGAIADHRRHANEQSLAILKGDSTDIQTYAQTTQMIHDDRDVITGADMFVNDLQEMGYETVFISSSPPAVTRPYAEELEADYVFRWKDFEFDEEGDFSHIFVNPRARKGKHEVVQDLKDEDKEVAYFGNGHNDKKAVNQAHTGIRQWWLANPEKAYHYAKKEAEKL